MDEKIPEKPLDLEIFEFSLHNAVKQRFECGRYDSEGKTLLFAFRNDISYFNEVKAKYPLKCFNHNDTNFDLAVFRIRCHKYILTWYYESLKGVPEGYKLRFDAVFPPPQDNGIENFILPIESNY